MNARTFTPVFALVLVLGTALSGAAQTHQVDRQYWNYVYAYVQNYDADTDTWTSGQLQAGEYYDVKGLYVNSWVYVNEYSYSPTGGDIGTSGAQSIGPRWTSGPTDRTPPRFQRLSIRRSARTYIRVAPSPFPRDQSPSRDSGSIRGT